MSKRQVRRAHLERMKAKARRVYNDSGRENPKAHYWANHLALCSCFGCGNPRKWFKSKTLQEQVFNDRARDEINAI